jgi:hypothetical protein
MITLQDIEHEKRVALDIIQERIDAATVGASEAQTIGQQQQWDTVLDDLNQRRDAVLHQAYEDEKSLPEMQAALAALKAATAELNKAAAKMTGVTTFLDNLANFGDATDHAIAALKKKT